MGIQINGTNDTITTNDGTISIDGGTTITGSLTGTTGVFSGDVGVAGTLTSEDKTNIDSVGLITARTGIKIGPITGVAATHYADGSIRTTGIITASSFVGSLAASNLTGSLPAISGANLTGISADVVDDTSPQLGGNLDVNTKNIIFGDSSDGSSDDVLIFGASSDLKLYHDGTESFIKNSTDDLNIEGDSIKIRAANGEAYITCAANGKVGLRYDNVEKFWTKSDGAEVEGTFDADRVDCNGLFHIQYGTSTNTNYMSSFNNNNGNMVLFRGDGIFVGDNMNTSNQAGGPNNQKIHLNTNGEIELVDSAKIVLGSDGDCKIHFNGTNTVVDQYNGNFEIAVASASEYAAKFIPNGSVELYHNNVKKFQTVSTGVEVIGGSNARSLKVNNTHTNGGEIACFDNAANNHYGALVVSGGEIDRECRLEAAYGNSLMTFWTQDASSAGERMRIDKDGNVLIGTATANTSSATSGIYIAPYGSFICRRNGNMSYWKTLDTGGYNTHVFLSANTTVGTIVVNSGGTAYNTSSDYRLKENVVDLTGAITRVKDLKPKRFNFIRDETNTLRDGFLAHEVSSLVPEAITGTKDAVAAEDDDEAGTKKDDPVYQQIDQSKLVPLLTAALQEAIAKIETLETKVAALES